MRSKNHGWGDRDQRDKVWKIIQRSVNPNQENNPALCGLDDQDHRRIRRLLDPEPYLYFATLRLISTLLIIECLIPYHVPPIMTTETRIIKSISMLSIEQPRALDLRPRLTGAIHLTSTLHPGVLTSQELRNLHLGRIAGQSPVESCDPNSVPP